MKVSIDIFTLHHQGNLKYTLSKLTITELIQLCKTNALDYTDSYKKLKDHAQLVDFIVGRVDSMMNRGKCFTGTS